MRDYGKVQSTFWTSDDIRRLSDTARMLALYLLTGPHTNQIGCFRLPDGYVSEDLNWTIETVQKGFAELSENGFANRDEGSKWVFINNFLKWNEIENPNQGKSAIRLFDQVPNSSSVKVSLAKALKGFEHRFKEDDLRVLEPFTKPFRNQEQEQEQDQEQIPNPVGLVVDSGADDSPVPPLPTAHGKPDCPHQKIIALYHEILPASPAIRDWTPARSAHLRTRWTENETRQDLDWWRRFFGYIAKSEFLTGKAHARDRKPFCAPLDWICKAENFAKIIEGRYHEEATA